ncbi:MAG TPA: tetraacyldisaccharide 4'-kinase [Chitinophagaceae bacterium]|jgi:tetraacyldisaccharide 4'-kinase|nr:tetraacyldisaccharide 4'-kinase [Chitinophagaceae bacterium]
MFSNWFLKSFRILLLPFSIVYWFAVWLRNFLYNIKILRSSSFGLPVICVGNLSVGGTGKSPMVEFLIGHLKNKFKVATLSRGYKRKTRGYALANQTTTSLDIGDEPMLFHQKFPTVPVAVGEERLVAIPQLLHDKPDTQVIVLDDAFQHRAVSAGLNILLTDYSNLFTRDFYLPTGDLRDLRSNYKRADIIVVTKCKFEMTGEEADQIRKEIDPLPKQELYFSSIQYGNPYHITNLTPFELDTNTEVLLVTGIASPQPLKKLLEEKSHTYQLMSFSDHYIFRIDDLKDIRRRFDRIEASKKIILTTEKDAMRLMKFRNELERLPVFVIPISHYFLFEEEMKFIEGVTKFIKEFKPSDVKESGVESPDVQVSDTTKVK